MRIIKYFVQVPVLIKNIINLPKWHEIGRRRLGVIFNKGRVTGRLFIWYPLGEISRQVRKNMSRFHMGDVFSPSEMKSARSKLAPNQNTTFHLGNRADVFVWRIFILPTYDLASHRRDLGKRASSI